MSRAFRKEDEDRPEKPPARPVGDRPNYVTPAGLKALQEALAQARADGDERNAKYFDERIDSAILVDPKLGKANVVAFGTTVSVRDEGGAVTRLRIVGEDEADPVHGTVSWISPYAQALLEHHIGERVLVPRPKGAVVVTIEAVERE